jgi:hypothetical protein
MTQIARKMRIGVKGSSAAHFLMAVGLGHQQCHLANVRFGSKADIRHPKKNAPAVTTGALACDSSPAP